MLMHREANPKAGRAGGLSLVFALTDEIIQDEEKYQYVVRAVHWFLPRYYLLLWKQEDESFVGL
jgi:hypothetical protein